MKSINNFVLAELQRVARFESWWKDQHDLNPEAFPLDMEDGDEGLWEEQLAAFEDTGPRLNPCAEPLRRTAGGIPRFKPLLK